MDSFKIFKLKATNFRNLSPNIIQFSPRINCIVGENGNGKTNILEAVHLMASKKTFRKKTGFPQFLSFDGEKPQIIISSVFKNDRDNALQIGTKMEGKNIEWFLDGKPEKKKTRIPIVFINPFESYGFHTQASNRRSWFDFYLSQLDQNYRINLSLYRKSLVFRNKLLKTRGANISGQIRAIDWEIAEYTMRLIGIKNRFLDEVSHSIKETFQEIFCQNHDLKIVLKSKFKECTKDQAFDLMQGELKKDLIIGFTSCGVHHDDYLILFDGLNSFEYCSLGQQKMSYLSLLFAYIELFRYKNGSYPIVLIDDVSGELDKVRWLRLVQYLKGRNFQVLITTANEAFYSELEKIDGAKRMKIFAGNILHENILNLS